MILWFAFFLMLLAQSAEKAEHERLLRMNKALLAALRETMVGQEIAEEQAIALTEEQASERGLVIREFPSAGKCPTGMRLSEAQCIQATTFGNSWGGADTMSTWWYGKETCGCYIDDGKRYYNRRLDTDYYCGADFDERMICWGTPAPSQPPTPKPTPPPPPPKCAAPNPYNWLLHESGKCNFAITGYGRSTCPPGYERIRTKQACQADIQRKMNNVHWMSNFGRVSGTPNRCIFHRQRIGVGSKARWSYRGYFNEQNADCASCKSDYTALCKLKL